MSGDSVSTAVELHCPLCDYDLRGLENPRCPECGYTFEWEELRKASEVEWKYFERTMRQKVRAYFRTLLLTFWLPALWQKMKTIDTIAPRRLVIFWMIPYLIVPVVIVTLFAGLCIVLEMNPSGTIVRNRWTFNPPPVPDSITARLQNGISSLGNIGWPAVVPVMMTALWPWLTLAALQVFNQSLFVAKIRAVQLMRVIIYTDMASVVLLLAAGFLVGYVLQHDLPAFAADFFADDVRPWRNQIYFVPMFVSVLMPLFNTGRLIFATYTYLRFRNAATMMVLSKVIVTLMVWTAIVMDDQLFAMNWSHLF